LKPVAFAKPRLSWLSSQKSCVLRHMNPYPQFRHPEPAKGLRSQKPRSSAFDF
jgi:hypothetical protein